MKCVERETNWIKHEIDELFPSLNTRNSSTVSQPRKGKRGNETRNESNFKTSTCKVCCRLLSF